MRVAPGTPTGWPHRSKDRLETSESELRRDEATAARDRTEREGEDELPSGGPQQKLEKNGRHETSEESAGEANETNETRPSGDDARSEHDEAEDEHAELEDAELDHGDDVHGDEDE